MSKTLWRQNVLPRFHPNQPVYSKDKDGLHCMIARLLLKRRVDKLKLRDTDTASRLGITAAELVTFQDELNAEGRILCRRLTTQSVYRFNAD